MKTTTQANWQRRGHNRRSTGMKKLLFLLILLPISSFGQFTIPWEEPTRGVSIAVDPRNSVYTLDYEYNLGAEMSLTKRDADGNLIWVTSYDQTDNTKWERASWVATDSAGNIIVTGTYMSGYSNPVEAASIVMKFSPNGTLKWRNVYENAFDGSRTVKCLVDANNNIYVLGNGTGPNGYVTKVKKFAPDGSAIWSYFDADGIGGVAQNFKFTPDGNLVIISRGITGSVNGYAKIDLNGNKIWSLAGVFSLSVGDAAGDVFGNTYVVHNEYVFDAPAEIKKLGPSGAILWDRVYAGISGRTFLNVGTDNQAVMCAALGGNGTSFLKINEAGNQVWLNPDADGAQNLLLPALMLMDENNNAYLAAGTLFSMAVCRVNNDGSTGWTALTAAGGYASSMVLGASLNSIFVIGGTTARIDFEGGQPECNTPTNISFNDITQSTLTMQWDPLPGVVEYEIWKKKSNSSNWKIQFVPGSKSRAKFKNLTCNTSFDFKIRSVCDESGTNVSEFSPVQTVSTLPCGLENGILPESR